MKYLVTHTLDNNERKKYEKMELYCYDLRDCDSGNGIASIERNVLVNNIGSIITNKELKFKEPPDDFIDYDSFVEVNEAVYTIEELLSKEKILKIKFIGKDSWDRPVYKDDKGTLYKDIGLGMGNLKDNLHTVCNNDFYGEPDYPINKDINVKVVKKDKNKEER